MHGDLNSRAEIIEESVRKVQEMNLFSNLFMSTALRDKGASEYVLRKILGKEDLEFTNVITQWYLPNLTSKESILDVYAEDVEGNLFNLEDQRSNTVNHAKRTRYYGAMLDKSSLDKGKEYNELTDVYIVYVSEKDIWKSGRTMYHVKKILRSQDGLEMPYDDGMHLIYVNAEVDDGSELAAMMKYFRTADPNDMSQGALSERVHYLKSRKGELKMCEVSEWIYNQGELKGREEGRALEIIDIYSSFGFAEESILATLQAKLNVSLDRAKEYFLGRKPA